VLLLALITQITFAQDNRDCTSDNQDYPGVSVVVKGPKIGTQTSLDGKFSIKASQHKHIFSYIELKKKVIASSTTINVKLKSTSES
jgi:hypothetical protein